MQAPIEYRAINSPDWQTGTTENVSCTGVLFRPNAPLEMNSPVAMRFRLPAEIAGPIAVQVVCAGRVVRQVQSHAPIIAVRIFDSYLTTTSAKIDSASPAFVPATAQRHSFVHQLNNDLAAIVGYCDLVLCQDDIDEHARLSIQHIKNAALQTACATRNLPM